MDSIEIEPIQCQAMDFTNAVSGDVQNEVLQKSLKQNSALQNKLQIQNEPEVKYKKIWK